MVNSFHLSLSRPSQKVLELHDRLAKHPVDTKPIVVERTKLFEAKGNNTPLKVALKELATEAVQETFNVDQSHFKFNVDATLDKLVICHGEEGYKKVINTQNEPGELL